MMLSHAREGGNTAHDRSQGAEYPVRRPIERACRALVGEWTIQDHARPTWP